MHVINELSEDFYWRCLENIDYSGVREPYRHTLRNFLERGLQPGEGLLYALEGDIRALLAFEDPATLKSLVGWIHGMLPAPIWGSPRKVQAWMKLARRVSSRKRDVRCRPIACTSTFSAAVL